MTLESLEPIGAILELVDGNRVATGINVYEARDGLTRQLRQQDRVLCNCDGTMRAVFACMTNVRPNRKYNDYDLDLGIKDAQPATVPPTSPPFSLTTVRDGHRLNEVSEVCVQRAHDRLVQITRGRKIEPIRHQIT